MVEGYLLAGPPLLVPNVPVFAYLWLLLGENGESQESI